MEQDDVTMTKLTDADLFHRDKGGDLMHNAKGQLRPDHSAWADWMIDKFDIITLDEDLLVYDPEEGRYRLGKERLKNTMEMWYSDFSTRDFSEIFNHIENRTFVEAKTMRQLREEQRRLVLMKNGVFDLDQRKLLDFSPEFYFTCAAVPIEYDPDADCPKVKQFVSEVVEPRDVPIVQEMFGYCYLKEMPFHKAFMFIGEGRNGKSTLINLLIRSLGRENVSQLSLQQISQGGFVVGHLKHKMANVYPDLPAYALTDTGYFKVLTGGDYLTVDRKFQSPTSFLNYAKMIFSCNKLPEAKDDSKAFFRRWILINFPNEFPPDKADPKLLEKLTAEEELSGVFNWAMEGLNRLLENGKFSYSETTDEIQDQYERLSNSLLAFVKDCVEADANGRITKSDFYREYSDYCRRLNLPVKSKTIVGRQLGEHITVSTGRHQRERAWVGIRLKTGADEEQQDFLSQFVGEDVEGPISLSSGTMVARQDYRKVVKMLKEGTNMDTLVEVIGSEDLVNEIVSDLATKGYVTEPKEGEFEWHEK